MIRQIRLFYFEYQVIANCRIPACACACACVVRIFMSVVRVENSRTPSLIPVNECDGSICILTAVSVHPSRTGKNFLITFDFE